MNSAINVTYKWARRIAIGLLGGSVLIIGLCMVVLPGPALVVIPLGLGILGLEFAWARRWLRKMREQAQNYVPGFKRAGNGVTTSANTTTTAPVPGSVEAAPPSQRASGSTSARNSPYDRAP